VGHSWTFSRRQATRSEPAAESSGLELSGSVDESELQSFLIDLPEGPGTTADQIRRPGPLVEPGPGEGDRPGQQSKRRRISVRAGLTTMDQGVASVSNFAVGVAVARVAGIAGLGAYSLAYTAWLALAAVHRSLITDPMAIENDLGQPNAAAHVRSGLAAELVLGTGCVLVFAALGGILLASGQHGYGVGFVAIAPWLPFLLAQDYWRWVGFMKAQPGKSLNNDCFFLVVQVGMFGLLFALGIRSTVLAIGAWGFGAFAGAAFGLWQYRTRPTLHLGAKRIRMRWQMSKWLLGSSTSSWGAGQAYVVLTGIILGPVGLGGLKAASSLINGPSLVLVQAGGSVGLPEASRALADRGWPGLRKVERVVTLAGVLSVGAIGLVILFYGKALLSLFYGHQFARFASIADILAVSILVSTLGLGAILSLKTTKQSRHLFKMGLVNLCGSVTGVVILAPLFGLKGAAASTLITSTLTTGTVLSLHWRRSRREAERLSEAARAGDHVTHSADPLSNDAGPAGERVLVSSRASALESKRTYPDVAYPNADRLDRTDMIDASALKGRR
jgi:O-antigen/teichoic acid export membrane protein